MAVYVFCPQESYRFIEQATTIMKAIGNVILNFGNAENLPAAIKTLEATHCPPGLCAPGTTREHFKVKKQEESFC